MWSGVGDHNSDGGLFGHKVDFVEFGFLGPLIVCGGHKVYFEQEETDSAERTVFGNLRLYILCAQ